MKKIIKVTPKKQKFFFGLSVDVTGWACDEIIKEVFDAIKEKYKNDTYSYDGCDKIAREIVKELESKDSLFSCYHSAVYVTITYKGYQIGHISILHIF